MSDDEVSRTDEDLDHGRLEELAAGYALDALDAGDERRFVDHLRGCASCEVLLATFREAALALGEAAPVARPAPELRQRVLAAAGAEPLRAQPGRVAPEVADGASADLVGAAVANPAGGGATDLAGAGPDGVLAFVPRRRHRIRAGLLAAAACTAVAGISAGVLASGGSGPAGPALPCATARASGCTVVQLTDISTSRRAATVEVHDAAVWLRPASLPADNASRQIYVLWEIAKGKKPRAVGGFEVGHGAPEPIRIGTLSRSYGKPTFFAVSLERGRRIPASPSKPVASGALA